MSEHALDTCSSSSSTNSHASLDSPAETQTQHSPLYSGDHASGPGENAQLRGGVTLRTPMSPQPSRPPPLALTRQLSKSAPSSPQRLLTTPSGKPPEDPSAPAQALSSAEATRGGISKDGAVHGSIQIPNRTGQQGWGAQLQGTSRGGSEGGSLGPLNGVSPPDGYMADTELAAARHRLHHSSLSFSDSGVLQHHGFSVTGVLHGHVIITTQVCYMITLYELLATVELLNCFCTPACSPTITF